MTGGQSRPGLDEAERIIREFAAANGLEVESGSRDGEIVVVLPGEQKLKTVCSLIVGRDDVSVSAFVIRHPDENAREVFAHLLRRNLRLPGLAYAIDADSDVYVVGRIPLAALDDAALDRLFGVVLQAADASFNDLLAMGFLTSMRREWRWRLSRGESLRNLEAFRELLDGPDAADDGGSPADGTGSRAAERGVLPGSMPSASTTEAGPCAAPGGPADDGSPLH